MFDTLERVGDAFVEEADPVKGIETALRSLADEDREHWTGDALSGRVIELIAVQERLAAEVLRLVGEWDRVKAWQADGSLSAAAWLEHRTPLAARRWPARR